MKQFLWTYLDIDIVLSYLAQSILENPIGQEFGDDPEYVVKDRQN